MCGGGGGGGGGVWGVERSTRNLKMKVDKFNVKVVDINKCTWKKNNCWLAPTEQLATQR